MTSELKFIAKYHDKEFVIQTHTKGDVSNYVILVDNEPLQGLEEDIFWTLLPYTKTIYDSKNTEIVKLNL